MPLSPYTGISSDYGPRFDGKHNGIDFYAKKGKTDVVAVRGGTVTSGYDDKGGNWVRIKHSDGSSTYYGHLYAGYDGPASVAPGKVIGKAGNSGWVLSGGEWYLNPTHEKGTHLHFGALDANGKYIDPALVLPIPK